MSKVPKEALTVGVGTVMDAKEVIRVKQQPGTKIISIIFAYAIGHDIDHRRTQSICIVQSHRRGCESHVDRECISATSKNFNDM